MDQRNTPASTGPHSRACGNCARAKAKCISKPGEKCGRCERLQKNCVPVVPVRRAKLAKKSANSTARLEEKLDGLFSLLKSGAQTSAPIGFQPAAHPDHQSADTSLKFQLDTPAESASNDTGATLLTGEGVSLSCHHSLCSAFNIGVNRGDFPSAPGARDGRQTDAEYERAVGDNPPLTFFQPRHSIQSTACHTPADIFSTHPYPTVEEANELLSFFASRMLPAFPFMKMPLYEHSVEFHKEHPFLYLCIIAVASKSTEQQLALGSIIRSTIGQKMLVESERTIDLLQGLLVYSGWLVALSILSLGFAGHPVLDFPSRVMTQARENLPGDTSCFLENSGAQATLLASISTSMREFTGGPQFNNFAHRARVVYSYPAIPTPLIALPTFLTLSLSLFNPPD
jgi:hypothetical protein